MTLLKNTQSKGKVGKIIFIVGNSRSGTTMLNRVFSRHSQVYGFNELHFFEREVDIYSTDENALWNQEKLMVLVERLITSAREGLFSPVIEGRYRIEAEVVVSSACSFNPIHIYENFLKLEVNKNNKLIPCKQTPAYLFSTGYILNFFPEAIVINMIRDPRDVMLSQKNKWRRRFLGAKNIPLSEAFRSWANYHPYTISRLWLSAVREGKKYEMHDRFKSIKFESLLADPEGQVKDLCNHIGITFEEDMLKVACLGSSAGIDKPNEQGISAKHAGSWLNGGLSNVEVGVCQSVVGNEAKLLGYTMKESSITFIQEMISMMTFSFKITLALLLNIRRNKNIINSIRRRLKRG